MYLVTALKCSCAPQRTFAAHFEIHTFSTDNCQKIRECNRGSSHNCQSMFCFVTAGFQVMITCGVKACSYKHTFKKSLVIDFVVCRLCSRHMYCSWGKREDVWFSLFHYQQTGKSTLVITHTAGLSVLFTNLLWSQAQPSDQHIIDGHRFRIFNNVLLSG